MSIEHNEATNSQRTQHHGAAWPTRVSGCVVLRPGLVIGLGRGHSVAQAVTVTQVHAWGFSFVVLNGGWRGDWRTDGTIKAEGSSWASNGCTSNLLYVQAENEKLPLHYMELMDYMEDKLRSGYNCPQLVLLS